MINRRLFSFAVLACTAATTWAGDFFFKDGDRVVFLGDSITEQRLYTTYIEAYTLTRYPNWQLTFRNVGWGGDTAWLRQRSHPDERQLFAADDQEQARMIKDAVSNGLMRDVLPLKPTAVTIKFGMNDHSYQPFRPDIFKAYVRSQTELTRVLESKGARVALLTPQPIEEKRADPDQDVKNQSLRKFSDGLKDVAQAQHALFVDQFDPYMAILLKERKDNPAQLVGGGDAVHPGPTGHTVMAWAVLKGLGASASVSKLEIDAAQGKVTSSAGCTVKNVARETDSVVFERTDEALPMPIDPKAEAALKLAPILQDLSQYELKVTGLPKGDYTVSIDGQEVARKSSEELSGGINLANSAGPITEQGRSILALIVRKNNVFFDRWRNVQLYQLPEWARFPEVDTRRAAEMGRLDRQVEDLEHQINDLRKPKPHRFEIKKAA